MTPRGGNKLSNRSNTRPVPGYSQPDRTASQRNSHNIDRRRRDGRSASPPRRRTGDQSRARSRSPANGRAHGNLKNSYRSREEPPARNDRPTKPGFKNGQQNGSRTKDAAEKGSRDSRNNADEKESRDSRNKADEKPVELSVEERRKQREAIKAKFAAANGHNGAANHQGESQTMDVDIEPVAAEEFNAPQAEETQAEETEAKEAKEAEEEDGVDDMFASDVEDDVTSKSTLKAANGFVQTRGEEMEKGLADNWDDPRGYYRFSKDEVLDGRYQLLDSHGLGKGMFSNVVRALDSKTSILVAIKIIRNNESMRKAAVKEMNILQKLADEDPGDKKHLVRLMGSFTHRGHLCMVFENLSQDLRELLKKFGRDTGFDMSAVRAYARQLFLGLDLLQKCNIIHADLKPDNILASEAPHTTIKICDLGSAFDITEAGDTPELASRFYRAPEVMLGIPYDYAIDMWSIGCTLFELFTGQILFTGASNNQMLRAIMECRGMFSERFVERGSRCFEHFEFKPFLSFRSIETDILTGQERAKFMQSFKKPESSLKSRLLAASPDTKMAGDRKPTYTEKLELNRKAKELDLFTDLLDKCLKPNPDHRIKPADALQHAFFGPPKVAASQFQPAFKRPQASKK